MKELRKYEEMSEWNQVLPASDLQDVIEAVQELQDRISPPDNTANDTTINMNHDHDYVCQECGLILNTEEKRYTIAELREKLKKYKEEVPLSVIVKSLYEPTQNFINWLESENK